VGAVGAMTETRAQSWAQTQIIADNIAADGIYPARFSCHGPEVGVVAPGVSILSTMPNNSFGVDDGTSMAAPHVTGLAALLLAHHPVFTSTFTQRNRERVSALFGILRQLCTPYGFSEARAGSGLPVLAEPTARILVPGATLAPSNAAPGNATNAPASPANPGENLHTLSAGPSAVGNMIGGNPNGGRPSIFDLPTQPNRWVSQMQPYGIVLLPAMQSGGGFYSPYPGVGRM
jgi:subtilisin family serine protease